MIGTMPVQVVEAVGDPHQRGHRIGRALAEPIGRSLAFYRRVLERRGVRPVDLPGLLAPFHAAGLQAFPGFVAELHAIADAADASFWELFAVNAWEELEDMLPEPPDGTPTPDRCTAFVAHTPAGPLLAHNEQWYAGDAGNVAVVIGRPDGGPAFASPTVVACLPSVGLNANGVALGVMSLTANDDGEGVPRVLVSRHTIEAADAHDVPRRAATPGRAGGYAYAVADARGNLALVETTATRHAVLDGPGGHTNHYLDPELAAQAPAPWPGSVGRVARVSQLLADAPPEAPEDAMRILSDHDGVPQPICLHPDPDDEESNAVLFSMVCLPAQRRMWVANGPPCMTQFEEIDVGGALGGHG